jgi:hypothetical protein
MLQASFPDPDLGLPTQKAGNAFLHWLAKTLDTGIIALALLLPAYIRSEAWPLRYTVGLLLAILSFHMIAGILNLYRSWPGESITRQFFHIALIWTFPVFVLRMTAYPFKDTAGFTRLAMTTWFAAAPLGMLLWRGWTTLA